MSIYEAIGLAWVIFTSAFATVEILYLAFAGIRTVLERRQQEEAISDDVPADLKEMFKIVR